MFSSGRKEHAWKIRAAAAAADAKESAQMGAALLLRRSGEKMKSAALRSRPYSAALGSIH